MDKLSVWKRKVARESNKREKTSDLSPFMAAIVEISEEKPIIITSSGFDRIEGRASELVKAAFETAFSEEERKEGTTMNRDKVTELLRNYRSYKYAIRSYETTGWVAMTGTQWSDERRSGSFGPRAPVKFSSDSLQDVADYNSYKRTVELIDGAIEQLTDEEQSVIRLKWMDELTLQKIADRKNYSLITIKRTHKKALRQLSICLRFVEVPEIEQLPVA